MTPKYDVKARKVDNDLAACEFYDVYLEARSNPSLDTRDLVAMDFEAREYLDYLEASEVAAVVCIKSLFFFFCFCDLK